MLFGLVSMKLIVNCNIPLSPTRPPSPFPIVFFVALSSKLLFQVRHSLHCPVYLQYYKKPLCLLLLSTSAIFKTFRHTVHAVVSFSAVVIHTFKICAQLKFSFNLENYNFDRLMVNRVVTSE